MQISDILFKLGIPTYVYTVETTLTNIAEVKIGETLPVDLGWVYGLSVNIDGATAKNATVPNITAAQAFNLYLSLKYGQSIYVNALRLTEMVFSGPIASTAPFANAHRWLPVNVPLNTDLKQSFISNPTLITGPVVGLNVYYIDLTSYRELVNSGQILRNGKRDKPV